MNKHASPKEISVNRVCARPQEGKCKRCEGERHYKGGITVSVGTDQVSDLKKEASGRHDWRHEAHNKAGRNGRNKNPVEDCTLEASRQTIDYDCRYGKAQKQQPYSGPPMRKHGK
jgi:hypothetical protein